MFAHTYESMFQQQSMLSYQTSLARVLLPLPLEPQRAVIREKSQVTSCRATIFLLFKPNQVLEMNDFDMLLTPNTCP
jgi:hypothetical protein